MAQLNEESTLSPEDRRLVLEEKKVDIEIEKLKVERLKAWTTGGSIVISLLIAALTVSFGVWNQQRQLNSQFEVQLLQSRSQHELQSQQSKLQSDMQIQQASNQFEMKAAEVVMNSESPFQALNKAKALANLFPDRLPNNFAASFNPMRYGVKYKTNALREYGRWGGRVR